jgi:hypothetical protein
VDYQKALVNNGIISSYWVLLQPGAVKAVMQADGNFVFYAKAIPNQRNETALWATNTAGQPGLWAVLQDDGGVMGILMRVRNGMQAYPIA